MTLDSMLPQAGQRSLAAISICLQVIPVDAQYQLVEIHQAGNLVGHGNFAPAITGYATVHVRWPSAAGWTNPYL